MEELSYRLEKLPYGSGSTISSRLESGKRYRAISSTEFPPKGMFSKYSRTLK